jgi:hypothetical protein
MVATAAVVAALSVGTASSRAGLLGCPWQPSVQAFDQFGDDTQYELAPGGAFEGFNFWRLSGGAQVVWGNEPFYLNSRWDSHSLYLPAGSSATSPPICLQLLDPTLRFVGKSLGGGVHVDVYTSSLLGLVKLPVSMDIPLGTDWNPSPQETILLENVLSLTNLGTNNITLKFSPLGSAPAQIDDVYVDPLWFG